MVAGGGAGRDCGAGGPGIVVFAGGGVGRDCGAGAGAFLEPSNFNPLVTCFFLK
jgi:hypothetical protein